jgi:hypothetical protein
MYLNRSLLAPLTALLLVACGGGGGGGSASTSGTSFSGTAAVGAPMAGATVNVYDKSGALVATTTADQSGAYTLSNVNSTNGPFVIEVAGTVGDANAKFYAISNAGGTANVSQVSHAIASSLSSSGNPADLTSGNSISSSQISTNEGAFTAALSGLMQSLNVSGSLVTQTFSSAMDAALDHIKISVTPSGIELSTSQGEAVADLMGTFNAGVDTPVAHKINSFNANTLPSANDAANLPGFSSGGVIASAATLETLRTKLQACFAHVAADRATQAETLTTGYHSPNWTAVHSDCQGLAFDTFKHESYYWIDNLTPNSTTIPSECIGQFGTCLGFFGAMLTDSSYDNLKFKTPTHISPVDVTNGIWKVQFPVQYSDNSLGQFGDVVGTNYAVVKYDPTAQQFKFYGNQRDVMTTIMPSVTRIQKAGTNNYRIEVGLNIYVNPYNSRALKPATVGSTHSNIYPVKAQIQPINSATGMLPAGGVFMANKVNTNVVANGVGSNRNYRFNLCTFMNFEDPSIIANSYYVGTANAAACSGVIRMNYKEYVMSNGSLVATPGAYTPLTTNIPSWISDWNASGAIQSGQPLVTTATAKKGEPYLFTITMSDGSVKKYVNRLANSTMTVDDAAKLEYPTFATGMSDTFAAFNGASNTSLTVNWNATTSSTVFADAIYWGRGEVNSTTKIAIGTTTNTINCPTSSTVVAGTNYNNDAVTNVLNCRESANWKASNASTPDSGLLQLKARTFEGLFTQSQLRQY